MLVYAYANKRMFAINYSLKLYLAMPYVPRPATTASCAHCGASYESRHLRRKYCSNSCNVLASYERNGRDASTRPTKADLEQMLATMIKLVASKPKPAAKAAASQKVVKKQETAKPTAREELLHEANLKAAKAAAAKALKELAAAKARDPHEIYRR